MIIYFRDMRIKDLHKQEAIINATVDLVNEIGFVSSSVSKIAKKAGVSPATLYIYYQNKEDLLVSTYIEIKKKLSKEMLQNFNETLPLRDILFNIWLNAHNFIKNNRELFQYSEQFSNSPYTEHVDHDELDKHFEPFIKVLKKGVEQKVIKDVSFDLLVAFVFYPIMIISNPKLCKKLELNDDAIETGFSMAWDAIKY